MDTYLSGLLYKKLAGIGMDPWEIAQVDKAIAEDPEIRKEWEQLQQTFSDPEVKAVFANIDHEAIFRRIISGEHEPSHSPEKRQFLSGAWKIAAGLLGFILMATSTYLLIRKEPAAAPAARDKVTVHLANGKTLALTGEKVLAAGSATIHTRGDSATFRDEASSTAYNTMHVPNRKTYTLRLGDGSTVKLNAATILKFPFSFNSKSREVYVNGEAYFNIAPDPLRPFIVHTDSADIRVLGTEFNLNTYDGKFVTALTEGAVKVSAGPKDIRLSAGKQVILKNKQLVVEKFDPEITLSWLTNTIYFEDVPLAEFARAMERVYDVKVVFDNPALARFRLTASISKNKPLQDLLDNLNAVSPGVCECSIDKQGIVHFH